MVACALLGVFAQTVLYTLRPRSRLWVGTLATNVILSCLYMAFFSAASGIVLLTVFAFAIVMAAPL